jgi:predicted amidophosphoribosyltransferase
MPCLSCKINGKLLNVLCRSCAEEFRKDLESSPVCRHNEDARALFGFFADVEIIHALHLGYRILEVY